MDVSAIFSDLNDAQRSAVAAEEGPVLVLAGAGSGKTRVLTRRVAWLVQGCGVRPPEILAVTFTNKAAREMRGRIEELLQHPLGGLWMGTFHGLSHRMLRTHAEVARLDPDFEIVDTDDQYRLVRRVLREMNLAEENWPPRAMQWMINRHKDAGRRARGLPEGDNPQQRTLYEVYLAYEGLCRRLNVVDFAELLLAGWELLRDNAEVREGYQQRFRHVLVDEFQDTSAIQYKWLRALSDFHHNLFAVGDDDQSIYGWRGARTENLLSFERDFSGATLHRLEQNYRSTGTILAASNAVIAHNSGRLGKELWTEGDKGVPIRLYTARDEYDEARFVVDNIARWEAGGGRRDGAAILYRSNAQSRVFESELASRGMPYRVYGGQRFFERAEVKDALAYMRLILRRDSDPAFTRVINRPARGIGERTMEEIRAHAQRTECSLWDAAAALVGGGALSARAGAAVRGFMQRIDDMAAAAVGCELGEVTEQALNRSGLLEHFKAERDERAQGRVENLEELVNAARHFTADEEEEGSPLAQFLAGAALEAGEQQGGEWDDCVQLMSLHSAKGLEFPLVFLCGMEEGLFPHKRSLDEDPASLQEERRLCYVGMTRAMQRLTLCHALVRRLYGTPQYPHPSRFLGEIPPRYIEAVGSRSMARAPRPVAQQGWAQQPTSADGADGGGFAPGQRVRHRKFGEGTVVSMEGNGENARVQVNFAAAGMKWLVCAYANLEGVG